MWRRQVEDTEAEGKQAEGKREGDPTRVRTARCTCGQLKLTCRGEPIRVSVCYCRACQRRTGSSYGVQARFASDSVNVAGNAVSYDYVADSGNVVQFSFCGSCGATTHWTIESGDNVAVAVGAFADENFPAPQTSVYEERRAPWVDVSGLVHRYD